MNPRFPLYIVSKGRWESRLTHRALDAMGVPHYIVVERDELESYAAVVSPSATLLVLDSEFQARYETCDELGDSKSKGPGPARNFVWEHARSAGAPWHWVMDDNIDGFYRFNFNLKTPVADGTIFACMEDFVERYSNVDMAGPNYFMFASRKSVAPPFVWNTRIYSCNLIRTGSPYYWRGRYNEDTDLSLRILKDGRCTVQFNAFLQYKIVTQRLRGGNSEAFYDKEGTLPKSRMLEEMHPDVARVTWRFNRWHHYVDYSPFRRNKPILRDGVSVPDGVDDYGMILEQLDEETGGWYEIERP